jgi:hypothetical protein
MQRYDIERLDPDPLRCRLLTAPAPGYPAPELACTSAEGAPVRLSDFFGRGPVVIELGSITCPQYLANIVEMRQVARRFPEAAFLLLYTREMCPGEGIPPHRTLEEKRRTALRLRDEEGEDRPILVDSLDGAGHRTYGGLPNALYVVDRRGVVVHRAPWADPDDVAAVLDALDRGRVPPGERRTAPRTGLRALLRTMRRAGRPGAADYARAASRLVARRLRRAHEE